MAAEGLRTARAAALAFVATLALAALVAGAARAQIAEPTYFTLQTDNDFFARATNTDRHYTTGIRAALVWPHSSVVVPFIDRFANADPFVTIAGTTPRRTFSVAIGQSIFTPDDTDAVDLVRDDRPYAAWLYLGLALQKAFDRGTKAWSVHDTVALEIGVVGPHAYGRDVQNSFHRFINQDESNGWHHQIRDEPGLNLNVERLYRSPSKKLLPGLAIDAVPSLALSLGNVATHLAFGSLVRLGRNLDIDFGPPRIRPGLPGTDSFADKDFSWYLFAGAEARVIGRDIFLDGNTVRDSHDVDKRFVVGDFRGGLALAWGFTRLTYTHTVRSPEFEGQKSYDQFGSVSLSFRF